MARPREGGEAAPRSDYRLDWLAPELLEPGDEPPPMFGQFPECECEAAGM
jgi:hypothetical protein